MNKEMFKRLFLDGDVAVFADANPVKVTLQDISSVDELDWAEDEDDLVTLTRTEDGLEYFYTITKKNWFSAQILEEGYLLWIDDDEGGFNLEFEYREPVNLRDIR